jgi:hypothetical protein
VSNPPARDGSLGPRVRPSFEDIEALIAPLQSLPKDEKNTHFEMLASTDDAEIDAMLSLLAGNHLTQPTPSQWLSQLGKNLVKKWRLRNPKAPAQSMHAK